MVSAMAPVLVSQQKPKPAAPGTAGEPPWNRTFKLSDGRTFVTDGALMIDAALAKPASLPGEVQISQKVIEGYLASPRKDEYGLRDLLPAVDLRTYTAPSGIVLNSTYVNYLRRTLPAARLRMTGALDPVQIVVSGKTVGVVMPVKK